MRPGRTACGPCWTGPQAGEARLGDAVASYALGYEIAGRAAEAALAGLPVAWAVMGATATAARLLRMPPKAIGLALQAAAREPIAGAAPPARAIALGILAAAGGIAPARDAAAGGPAMPVAEHGRWLLLEGAVRAFAGARPLHHVGAAALALHPSAQGRLPAIRAIRVTARPEAVASCGIRAPATSAEALVSLSWAAAALADPMLRALEARVMLLAGADGAGTEVALDFPDGSIASRTDGVPGDPAQPMSEPGTVAKFTAFAAGSLSRDRAVQVVRAFLTGPPEMLLAGRLFTGALTEPVRPGARLACRKACRHLSGCMPGKGRAPPAPS